MPIFLPDPVAQTLLFELLLGAVIIFSLRLKKNSNLSPGVSSELKGVAILAVIFGHAGYYLSSDTRFLYPLSIMAGVGVNLFLFLSGYGLTLSNEEKPLSSIQFYRKRLGRLFIPLWITLGAILLADAYFLNLHYPINEIIKAAFGFFPHANLYTDINSPLWYFTFIGGYYLLFPLVNRLRAPLVGGFLLLGLGQYLTHHFGLKLDVGVLGLYRLHIFAFPLGCICADLAWYVKREFGTWQNPLQKYPRLNIFLRTVFSLCGVALICYLLIHSGVGSGAEHEARISLLTMFITIGVAMLLPLESRFLLLVGTYSYELYLAHWPLMYRYHILYTYLPPAFATALYLAALLGFGYLLSYFVNKKILSRSTKKPS